MGLALYRKYRPKKLSDVVGQDAVVQTLQNALKIGAISHAYLFTGPRGVGKTSIARILAHEINALPYDEETTHLDIIEIDAASNRRIDEIRDLRDKVHIAPTSSKYKVYIIDEVHMLTREAFNALLKTLEEPPAHVVFILATTEAHKVPETITSRTQKFVFKPIAPDTATKHLATIAKSEKIKATDDALHLVSIHAKGSFRDSINTLDQLATMHDTITVEAVEATLGIAPESVTEALLAAALAGEASTILTLVQDARVKGIHAATLAHSLLEKVRHQITLEGVVTSETIQLLDSLATIQSSSEPYMALELALLSLRPSQSLPKPTISPALPPKKQITTDKPDAMPITLTKQESTTTEKIVPNSIQEDEAVTNSEESFQPTTASTMTDELWATVLQNMKGKHNTLYGTLRMATPHFDGTTLTLLCRFAFHQKQLSQAQNVERIRQGFEAAVGVSATIVCLVEKATPPTQIPAEEPSQSKTNSINADHLSDISNIFDGAELLE